MPGGKSLGEQLHLFIQFWKAADVSLDFHILLERDGGFTGVGDAAFKGCGDAGAGGEDRMGADGNVPADADLGGDGDVILDSRTSGNAGLGDDEAVFPDYAIVADLDEVVDFGALSDHCLPEACAVDGGVGADFDIVAYFHDAHLVDFAMDAINGFISIAIGSNDGTRLDDNPVAKNTSLADDDVGANAAIAPDDHVRVNDGVG